MTNTLNKESKSLLAKLMASEDLHVEYSENAATASFDTESRLLTVPIFKDDMSVDATDLMLGHEVGHALFTPQGEIIEVLKKGGLYKNFVNIVEDARIEKMIQSKFPGLRPIFKNAYNELMDKDFFGTNGDDINTYNFIDRLNIHFKAGIRAGVEFSEEEMTYVKRMENLRNWEETIALSDDLYEYCKAQDKKEPENNEDSNNSETESPETSDGGADGEMSSDMPMEFDEPDDSEESDDSDDKSNSSGEGEDDGEAGDDDSDSAGDDDKDGSDEGPTTANSDSKEAGGGSDEKSESLVSKTQDKFNRSMEESVDSEVTVRQLNIPPVNLKNVIVPTAVWHKAIDEAINSKCKEFAASRRPEDVYHISTIDKSRSEWKKFSSEQKTIVSYMVKEFEMRKSADEHKRTSVADTGMLNPNKLHAYKFSDDIFLKNAVVADGKNHGFIMYLDWSGSMRHSMSKTIDQLMLLAMFCKRSNIPFDCFAFTNRHDNRSICPLTGPVVESRTDKDIAIREDFKLIHLISSKVKTNDFNNQMAYLIHLNKSIHWEEGAVVPGWLSLGGTPLNETVIMALEMVPAFRKMYNVQIVNVVFLTDGQGGWVGSDSFGSSSGGPTKTFMTDPVTRKRYELSRDPDRQFDVLMDMLKNRNCNTIGFFISSDHKNTAMRDICHLIGYEKYYKLDNNLWWKAFIKNGYSAAEVAGYDKFYVIHAKGMDTQVEDLHITDDMTKAKMRTAFIKNRKTKLNSKKMLSEFCEVVS